MKRVRSVSLVDFDEQHTKERALKLGIHLSEESSEVHWDPVILHECLDQLKSSSEKKYYLCEIRNYSDHDTVLVFLNDYKGYQYLSLNATKEKKTDHRKKLEIRAVGGEVDYESLI